MLINGAHAGVERVHGDTTGIRGKRAVQRWRLSRLLICPDDGSTQTIIPHKAPRQRSAPWAT